MQKIVKKNKTGFTLVELLCAITILAVLSAAVIFASYKLIDNAHSDYQDSQEKIVISTVKTYLQDKTERKPKTIGDSNNITLKELKAEKYLKEDITDSKNNSCMDNSYVRVYKLNKEEYTYLAYIYCNNETPPEIEEVPAPTIKIHYADDKYNKINSDSLKNIRNTKFYIELTGGINYSGSLLELDKYKYSISIKESKDDEYKEIYDSKYINTNRNQNISLVKDFKEYIDKDYIYSVKLDVEAINTTGGLLQLTSYLQSNK